MLEIGSFKAQLHGRISRRAFLAASASLPLSFAASSRTSVAAPDRRKARSIILLWLWGGPSQLDTFDPKPNAPANIRGPFSTIPTRTTGIRFTELFPRMAARSNRFALIRTMKNFHGGHLEAGTTGLTGSIESGLGTGPLAPNFGSIVAKYRGNSDLPSFFSVGRGTPRDIVGLMKGFGGGTWGKTYDPFPVACAASGEVDIPALKLLDGMTPAVLANRRTLLERLDRLRQNREAHMDKWDANQHRAYALLTAPEARKALDLSQESPATRDAYGHTAFGQSCLLARRLAEAEVPYIQVNWSQYVEAMTPNCDFGWDTHIFNFDLLPNRHAPILDRAFSALLDDLQQRGLLDSTLVLAMGEFGRTPRINGSASRDHWPRNYFSIWAGCGVRPGLVLGESDPSGDDPTTEPITPAMVGATICELAGIDTQARAELGVLTGARAIHELF